MKQTTLVLLASACALPAFADPLRVYVRGGTSNRGEEVHAHTRFAREWPALLSERGMKAEGGTELPTDEQLARTDVVLFYAQEGGTWPPSRWMALESYLKRGGGLVVLHTAAVSEQPDHWKTIIGGTWRPGTTKWREGPMDLYYTENQYIGGGHPITRSASNFHFDDEIYYDLEYLPEIKVLASSYTPNVPQGRKQAEGGKAHIYDIQAQMWTYERTIEGGSQPYRAFVSIPGHLYKSFALPHYRAIVMRGLAWAGKRDNIDEFTKPEEISSLTYPDGGPMKPDATLANLEIHPDFDLKLVAAEPLITKPMNFDWAPDGSLWVAETPEYPNGRRGMRPDYRGKEWKDHGGIDPTPGEQRRAGLDKISRLSDSDGDGVMDKKTVFFEGLDLVTGLVFHKDGVIVTQAPDILWLRDTDHDGKADKVEKLYGNLGTGDTHAVINNPRWGWDGWIYATHGYSGSGNVVNAKGEKQPNIGSGVVRFKPDGSAIEQYSSKGGNTWGLQITNDNRVMWTQPTSGTILEHVVVPEYALARGKWGNTPSFNVVIGSPKSYPAMPWEQLAYVQIDLVGSFTATAGTVIYDGGSWPAEYNGDYFTTEPTINIVHHERLTQKGSSYEGHKLPGREETEFIRSKDMWWRPIEVRVGPDGAVYVGDFYNQAVIHNDTRGPDHNNVNAAVRPDRDHYFGRIWKLDHKQAKKIKVPDLSTGSEIDLAKALSHPNRHVRMTARRLLGELAASKGVAEATPGKGIDSKAVTVVSSGLKHESADTRIASLWTMGAMGLLAPEQLAAALDDQDASVRRNAALGAEVFAAADAAPALEKKVADPDARVRVAALIALAAAEPSPSAISAIIAAWPKFTDDFERSAAVGALAANSAAAIAAILDSGSEQLAPLASILAQSIGEKNDAAAAAKLVAALSSKPASADALKRSILDTLGKSLKAAPEMTPDLAAALTALLKSGAAGSALPLAAQWDKAGALKGAMADITAAMFASIKDAAASDDARFAAAQTLLGLRKAVPDADKALADLLAGNASPALKIRLISAMSDSDDAALGAKLAAIYSAVPADVQTVAFTAMLKRAEWSLGLLDAVKAKQIDPALLGPANIYRLRTHPDKAVAKRATAMMDELLPGAKAKAEVIAKLAPEVEKKGNIENGKLLFTSTCATCHKFGSTGAEVGPNLTGMGAHGAGELLAAIVDPNAEVDPSFTAWNIETKDGKTFAGVIARENPASVFLKFQGGEQDVKTADIKTRSNTGRSLMPEGFEGLGPDILRDIIAYMQSVDGGRFRTLDLRNAFTTTTSLGLYESQDHKEQSLAFRKTGTVPVEGIPFNIVGPEKSPNNIVVLKGGPEGTFAGGLPAKVDIKVGGFKANRIHFLGGVTGWGWQPGREESPVLKITVHTTQGQRETFVCKNGVEFSDYIGRIDVPGSKFAPGLVRDHQVRWFTKALSTTQDIERITLESVGFSAAPTVVAITAELSDKPAEAAPAPAPEKKSAALEWKPGTKILLIGGGSSHDYQKWFNEYDTKVLIAAGYSVNYTEDAAVAARELANVDAAVLSANHGSFSSIAFRDSLTKFVDSGKGLVILHPGLWYNWGDWAEYNKTIAGGGSRGHDRFGEFKVNISKPDHPLLKGVNTSFSITDELYYYQPDPAGTPIEILASATSTQRAGDYPQVFVVKHPKTRIAGLTLGHDGKAHELAQYQQLLLNCVAWTAKK
jgi:putative membrane-bound dehydrogenase-like protein